MGLDSSLRHQNQISAVNPKLYAKRFRDYVFARVRQPDTPQTPREVVGLPPRLPEAGGTVPFSLSLLLESNRGCVDQSTTIPKLNVRKWTPLGVQARYRQTRATQKRKKTGPKGKLPNPPRTTSNRAKTKRTPERPIRSPTTRRRRSRRTNPWRVPSPTPKGYLTTVRSKSARALAAQSASMDQEGSPRAGNAGLIPKQLKVEKKKQQKMAAKKQKKTLPAQHEDTASIQQPHPADKGKSIHADVASAAAPTVSS